MDSFGLKSKRKSGINISKSILFLLAVLHICPGQSFSTDAITISRIEGFDSTANGLMANTPIKLYLNYETDSLKIVTIFNGFKIYSPDGATWNTPDLRGANPAFDSIFPSAAYIFFEDYSVDGQNVDTLFLSIFQDLALYTGIPPGYSSDFLIIELNISEDQIGKSICFDTVSGRISIFVWGSELGTGVFPAWDDSYCFEIVDCCAGIRGDVNGDGLGPNNIDLVNLVNYLFRFGPVPWCALESDLNGDNSPYNILGLNYMVNFIFRNGPLPGPCPAD